MKSITSLFFALIISHLLVGGQVDMSDADSANYSIDEQRLQELKSDSDFNYDIHHAGGTSLLSRIWTWIKGLLTQLFYWRGTNPAGKIITYVLIIGAIVYTILKMVRASPAQLLKKSESKIRYQVQEEDIHTIPFEEQVQIALENKNYKLAVRLNYLNALKHLSDANLITWIPGKSNHDYTYELSGKKVVENFIGLSRLFEYCWYGGFDVNKPLFEKSRYYVQAINTEL